MEVVESQWYHEGTLLPLQTLFLRYSLVEWFIDLHFAAKDVSLHALKIGMDCIIINWISGFRDRILGLILDILTDTGYLAGYPTFVCHAGN